MRYGDFSDKVEKAVKEELDPIDMDTRYKEALDDVYSFASVGGPFENMLPSKVLEEMDPTAYRCGFNDWLDAEEVAEIGADYYDLKEVEEIEERIQDEEEEEAEK